MTLDLSNYVTNETTRNADAPSGYFSEFECLSSISWSLTQAEVQGLDESGGWRSMLAAWHTDDDATDYMASGYRSISDALHVGVFGKRVAGVYQSQYKDMHGITSHAIGRIEWPDRGTAAFVGDAIQFGAGVCLNEMNVYNPASSATQSKHMVGLLSVLAGKKGAADATHFVRGIEIINIGKLATAAFEAFSAGTDGDNGHFDYLLKGNNVVAAQGGISMPQSAAGHIGTWIIYDTGDYSQYDRAGNAFGWVVGGVTRMSLNAGGLSVAGSPALTAASFGTWTPYTPALSVGVGALGSASATGRYLTVNKLTFFNIVITIANNGTAGGYIEASLPRTCAAGTLARAREDGQTGYMLQGKIDTGGTKVRVFSQTNAYPAMNGAVIVVAGEYES